VKPRLLDLYCGAGGAAEGYRRAGFDVTGVDIKPQPRYPFTFICTDATTISLAGYDAYHASPPCQDHIARKAARPHGTGWMLAATRQRLTATGRPWVIENVPGAPMRADYTLCGCMFGLDVRRERWFETSWHGFTLRPPCDHHRPAVSVYGHGGKRSHMRGGDPGAYVDLDETRKAMGITWMTTSELSQAIPPDYTHLIGAELYALTRDTGDPCPACGEADLETYGGKLRCPECFYLQPCCQPP
jgi:DNA (cytosine-5)-methyltransferase 1